MGLVIITLGQHVKSQSPVLLLVVVVVLLLIMIAKIMM